MPKLSSNQYKPHSWISGQVFSIGIFVFLFFCYAWRNTLFYEYGNLISGDNLNYFFPNHVYIVRSIRTSLGWPTIYPSAGPVPFGVLAIPYLTYLPYKLIGVALGVLGMKVSASYVLSIYIGVFIFTWGVWSALNAVTEDALIKGIGLSFILFGGLGGTVFHQEQILATIFWYPWILQLLRFSRTNPIGVPFASLLVGSLATTHLPFIHWLVFSLSICGVVLVYARKRHILQLKKYLIETPNWAKWLAAVTFLIGIAPALSIYEFFPLIESGVRRSGVVEVSTLSEYLADATEMESQIRLGYLSNFFAVNPYQPDPPLLNLSIVFFPLLVISLGFLFGSKILLFLYILTALLFWSSFGVHGGIPQLLFQIQFPFIQTFRQWYHLVPIIVLLLTVISIVTLSKLVCFHKTRGCGSDSFKRAIEVVIFVAMMSTIFLDGLDGFREYAAQRQQEVLSDRHPDVHLRNQVFSGATTMTNEGLFFSQQTEHIFFKKLVSFASLNYTAGITDGENASIFRELGSDYQGAPARISTIASPCPNPSDRIVVAEFKTLPQSVSVTINAECDGKISFFTSAFQVSRFEDEKATPTLFSNASKYQYDLNITAGGHRVLLIFPLAFVDILFMLQSAMIWFFVAVVAVRQIIAQESGSA